MFGYIYITTNLINNMRYVLHSELDYYLSNGWIKGRI